MEEYKLTNSKIEEFLQSQHKYINSLLLLIAGCFVFIFDSDQTSRLYYLLYLPFVFICIIGVFIYHYKRTMGLQGYKRYLEGEINNELKSKTLFYGELGNKYMIKRDPFSLVNFISYIVIYVGLVGLANTNNPDNYYFTILNISMGLSFLLLTIHVFTFSEKIEQKAIELGKADLELKN